MELKKLISKFLTNLCEDKYSEANKDLNKIVEEKTKQKVKKTYDKITLNKKEKKNKKCDDKKKSSNVFKKEKM